MAESHDLSIILPARNEAESLSALLPDLRRLFPDAQILVIDDASADSTAAVALAANCQLISLPYNIGNGAAVKAGIRAATGSLIATMDADGQHRPEDLGRLIERFREGEFDMVVGARESADHSTVGRRIANRVFNRLASWMTGQRVQDLTSGLRIARAHMLREFLSLMPSGFSYPTTITMAFFRSGYTVEYLPVRVLERIGRSHIRPGMDGVRFLLIIFRIGSLYSPLKFFVPVSLALFLVASAIYAYTYSMSGRFSNMSVLLYSTSLLTFLMGLVSEQITNLMYMVKDRGKT
jgi:glycosyltransferase involved in cell wall biosynthesis